MKVVLACSCSGQKKKAEEAFSILFPGEPMPKIILGKDNMMKFANEMNNDHLKAIAKLKGRFAYYVEIENNNIIAEWNLSTGRRVG